MPSPPANDESRFAAGIAHDFNIALQIILFNVECLLDRHKEADKDHRWLVEIREAAERALTLNRQVIDYVRKREMVPSSSPVQAAAYPGGMETILLADDNPTILKIGEIMLQRLGYKVIAANGPLEAVRLAGSCPEKIDLLMTDMVMPEMTGKELADHVIATRPGLRVLFMSGFTSDVAGGRAAVVDDTKAFIQKPFTMPSLAQALRKLLDRPAPA